MLIKFHIYNLLQNKNYKKKFQNNFNIEFFYNIYPDRIFFWKYDIIRK